MSKDELVASLVNLQLFREATSPATGADWRNRISLLNFWTWETFLGEWSTRKFVTAAKTFDFWVSGLPYFTLQFISLPPFYDINMVMSSCSAELHFVVELSSIWLIWFWPLYVSSVHSIPVDLSSLSFCLERLDLRLLSKVRPLASCSRVSGKRADLDYCYSISEFCGYPAESSICGGECYKYLHS